jgi:hypothetical protein
MATFLVTNLNDSGPGSLRAAITAANLDQSGTPTTINFSVAGTINVASALPNITNDVIIDATTAPGYIANGAPVVTLNYQGQAGLTFGFGAGGSELLGLALGNASGHGVTLFGSNITIDKCYIGLAANGADLGNGGDGIFITAVSSYNHIGLNEAHISGVIGNVISANNGNGITIFGGTGNVLEANRIGTAPNGESAMGNGLAGVHITNGALNNIIGGTAFVDTATGQVNNPTGDKGTIPPTFVVPPLGNLISGNTGDGVLIDSQSQNNVLHGNFIGTVANGDSALGNGRDGVHILGADNNSLIGCEFENNPFVYYNVISGNAWNGLHITDSDNVVVQANFFGIGANNASLVGNGYNGILVNGNSQGATVGGVIPLGNVSAGNGQNGIYVTDTASDFITFNTFGGLFAFQGAAPNGENGIHIDSTGGGQTIQTNVFSGNIRNGIMISGDASDVTVDPNMVGLVTDGNAPLPNGMHGIAIYGTAHDITVGGNQQSVIPQNTFSGNVGYGVALFGEVYNINVLNSFIGTDTLGTYGIGNHAGGILVATSGTNNQIGGITTDPQNPQPNLISGNHGDGITLLYGTAGTQIISNSIGLDRFGFSVIPNEGQTIGLNGSYTNTIGSNIGDGSNAINLGLPPQEAYSQIEALYIGYFGRAGDPNGMTYWSQHALGDLEDGETLQETILHISQGFATSAENAPYNQLANQPLDPNNPTQVALATSFIEQTYQNLFNRAPDNAGLEFWLAQLFNGNIPYSALVYSIESSASAADRISLNSKIEAGSYLTQNLTAAGLDNPSVNAMTDAVAGVINQSTMLLSKAATEMYSGFSLNQVTQASIFDGAIVTGVRGDYNGNVVLTGSQTIVDSSNVQAILYRGPMQDTELGTIYALTPQFAGQTVASATFYGPNTSAFDETIAPGEVRAVGSYVNTQSTDVRNHGMMYEGRIDGVGGTWTKIDVPNSEAGGNVWNTIVHSTMGDLAVGNYDIYGEPGSGNAFIYNIRSGEYILFDAAFGGTRQFTTAYGIWQNGQGSDHYTIVGGSKHGIGVNQAFVANYNARTGEFSDITYYDYEGRPEAITHFEGITAVPGGFNLIATTDDGAAFASITVNDDGSFSDAQWTLNNMVGAELTTGNSVFQNIVMGIYMVDGASGVNTYNTVVDQSYVSELGGLIMPVGAPNYTLSETVESSTGALIVGSRSAGNVLGGSIGNDLFNGTENVFAADTIYTGGGADKIDLADNREVGTRIELFAGNSTSQLTGVLPGQSQTAVLGSIVSADDVPQLGWWGQATGQRGGAVSDESTNGGFGTGTSLSLTNVVNFITGAAGAEIDSLDFSLKAFSYLLRDTNPGAGPILGDAIFSNVLRLGGTVTVNDANVLIMSGEARFDNAAELSFFLSQNATAINFGATQTDDFNHYLIAYEDTSGFVRIADMSIQSDTNFTRTNQGDTLAISDMVRLVGVSIDDLQAGNVQFVL